MAGETGKVVSKPLLPEYQITDFVKKKNNYVVCIPVLNEGERILNQLRQMQDAGVSLRADTFICDGGSTDGSMEESGLRALGVNSLIVRTSPGHLSDQLMLGYYFALERGYRGVVTVDGNGKDGVEGVFTIIDALEQGYCMVQGSRYIKGGRGINTPKYREFAIKLIHVPAINRISGFHYTDTTNGFRGHLVKAFADPRVSPFRYGSFPTYSLIHYLTVRLPELGYPTTEVPVIRRYPPKGKIPTKISPLKGNLDLLKILCNLSWHQYDP